MSLYHLLLFVLLETLLLLGIPVAICSFAKVFKLGTFKESANEPRATTQKA